MSKVIPAVIAICCLTLIAIYAISHGITDPPLHIAIIAIAGLGGYYTAKATQ
jgi:hypothetical protein